MKDKQIINTGWDCFVCGSGVLVYTDADQQADYPGDRGFEFVPALQTMSIPWGGNA